MYINWKTNTSNYKFEVEKPGKLFWQIETSVPDLVDLSPVYNFSLEYPKVTVSRAPKIILSYQMKRDCYSFSLPKNKFAQTYEVYIYSTRTKIKGKPKLMYHKILEKNNDCIKSKGEGKYNYKYRIKDRWGRDTSFSKMGDIFFPISPLDSF